MENLEDSQKIEKVILVAGWFFLSNLEDEESAVLNPWMMTPLDFGRIKQHARRFIAILSDNDPWVPLEENKKVFEEKLASQVLIEHHKGHFNNMPQERPDSLLNLF